MGDQHLLWQAGTPDFICYSMNGISQRTVLGHCFAAAFKLGSPVHAPVSNALAVRMLLANRGQQLFLCGPSLWQKLFNGGSDMHK